MDRVRSFKVARASPTRVNSVATQKRNNNWSSALPGDERLDSALVGFAKGTHKKDGSGQGEIGSKVERSISLNFRPNDQDRDEECKEASYAVGFKSVRSNRETHRQKKCTHMASPLRTLSRK